MEGIFLYLLIAMGGTFLVTVLGVSALWLSLDGRRHGMQTLVCATPSLFFGGLGSGVLLLSHAPGFVTGIFGGNALVGAVVVYRWWRRS